MNETYYHQSQFLILNVEILLKNIDFLRTKSLLYIIANEIQ